MPAKRTMSKSQLLLPLFLPGTAPPDLPAPRSRRRCELGCFLGCPCTLTFVVSFLSWQLSSQPVHSDSSGKDQLEPRSVTGPLSFILRASLVTKSTDRVTNRQPVLS